MTGLSSPPFVEVGGVHNFRALLLPKTSRPLLYRSAALSQITSTGISTLKRLGITHIYDLRSHPEALKNANPSIPGTETIHVPVFFQTNYSPETIALRYKNYASDNGTAGFVRAYEDILESGGKAFAQVFGFLRDTDVEKEKEKCVVHCSAGKDRTGVVCALVLMLAEVPDEQIAEEYALSEQGLNDLKPMMVERLLEVQALEGDKEGVERMIGSRKESMLATIAMIRKTYGGAEGYLKSHCGLSIQDIEKIRGNIINGQ